jgi:hypothetical protein
LFFFVQKLNNKKLNDNSNDGDANNFDQDDPDFDEMDDENEDDEILIDEMLEKPIDILEDKDQVNFYTYNKLQIKSIFYFEFFFYSI